MKHALHVGALAGLLLFRFADAAPTPAHLCAAAKMKATGKRLAAKAICHAKAYKQAVSVDPACLAKAEAKFLASFAKADANGGCALTDNAAPIEAEVDACIAGLVPDLAPNCGDAAGPGGTDLACSCGDTVVTDTTLDLSFDPVATTTCIGDGLRLGAGVQLDLNGLVISGSGGGEGLSVRNGGTVSGGTVRDFGVGLRVGPGAAASLVTAAGMIIEDNAGNGVIPPVPKPSDAPEPVGDPPPAHPGKA